MDVASLNSVNLITDIESLNRRIQTADTFQAALENAAKTQNDKELRNACQEFESYFINMMFREMRKTVDTSNSYIQKNNAQRIFEEMLDEEYSSMAAKTGRGIGLADMMYKQMKREHSASVSTAE